MAGKLALGALLLALVPVSGKPQAAPRVFISGSVVNESDRPLPQVAIYVVDVVKMTDCCVFRSGADGTFSFEVASSVYALSADLPPLNRPFVRVDARSGSVAGVVLRIKGGPIEFLPEDPPRASLIQISNPDSSNKVTLTGAPGAVPNSSYVIIVTLETGHLSWMEAAADGSFQATHFAPAGASLFVKADPIGIVLRDILHEQEFGGEGSLAPLTGTIIGVPDPPASGGETLIAGVGLIEKKTPPIWIFQGQTNGRQFSRGETLTIVGTLKLESPALSDAASMRVTIPLNLELLAGSDGGGALANAFFASALVTPTGLPIERGSNAFANGSIRQFVLEKTTPDRAEASIQLSLTIPSDIPEGMYRPVVFFDFQNVPRESPPSQTLIVTDKLTRRRTTEMHFPVVRVGRPASPRLFWTLLTDSLSNGSRGTVSLEDRNRFDIASQIVTQSETFVLPRVHSPSGKVLKYLLEPFAPTVSIGDRAVPPSVPLIPFRFPSGYLRVHIQKPDGTVETLGPAPFVQPRTRILVTRQGRTLDFAGGHITDAYQLSTMDPRFEIEFAGDGLHVITLEGAIDDIWGNQWKGGGTYLVHVARTLSLDTSVLPGTPFEVGNAFKAALVITPPVPAEIEIRAQLYPNSEVGRKVERVIRGRANRFGQFQPFDGAIGLDQPGEYRVDVTASYHDEHGELWMGSRTWGGVVAELNPPIIAHGRRGVDGQNTNPPIWFFMHPPGGPQLSGHVFYPFQSGDVTWQRHPEAALSIITIEDPSGSIRSLLGERYGSLDETRPGEIPLLSSRKDRVDPHIDPSKVDLWAYSYRSVQRPLVRVREHISEDFVPSRYWQFREQYAKQLGVGENGDLANDFKFQFGAAVLRGSAFAKPHYAVYGSLFILIPDEDPLGTRTFPPFQGNGGGPSGGPLFKLKDRGIDIFFHPTGVRPGTILTPGNIASFAGQIGPTLPSKVEILVSSPSGRLRTIAGQANRVGYFYQPWSDFVVDEAGVWRARVKVWHDGQISAGQVQPPYPTGDVLGSREGEFYFYVVDRASPQLELAPMPQFVRPAEKPITFTINPPAGLTNIELYQTTVMPGFILEEAKLPTLRYTYDAPRLARDFPNLDLHDAEGFAGVDTITMSFFLTGTDSTGGRKYFGRQVVLQGEELQMPDQNPRPRRRAVSR